MADEFSRAQMSLLKLLHARSKAQAIAARPIAVTQIESIFSTQQWGSDIHIEPYSAENADNIWKHELRGPVRRALTDAGKGSDDFASWLGGVHFIGVAIYSKRIFTDYRQNVGWRVQIFALPRGDVVSVGVASHYQKAQNHNRLAEVSQLLCDFASEGLSTATLPLAIPGRKIQSEDWDKGGLLPARINSLCGVDIASIPPGDGLHLKDIRTTTVKKILASFIFIEALDASTTESQFLDKLREVEKVSQILAEKVYPFRGLQEFEDMRSLAYEDLASAKLRFRLRRRSTARSVVRIYYGPPGTGKTLAAVRDAVKLVDPSFHDVDKPEPCFARFNELRDQMAFVTFHQSLQYEDAVESIRPELVGEAAEEEAGDGDGGLGGEDQSREARLRYRLHEGVFLRMIRRAAENSGKEYVIVVDEINRGDVSRILGPLISALDPDKRAGAEFPVGFELQYPRAAELESRMFLPANLHVIGTMNSADRNIALVDLALRRRFEFLEAAPQPELLAMTADPNPIDMKALLTKMNERIRYLLDRDHCIGHGYFMQCKRNRDVVEVLARKILPLLRECFYGNEGLMLLVVADSAGGARNVHIIEKGDEAFQAVFGVEVETAIGMGYRTHETRMSLRTDPRFWNEERLPPGPEDEEYAASAIRKIYAAGVEP